MNNVAKVYLMLFGSVGGISRKQCSGPLTTGLYIILFGIDGGLFPRLRPRRPSTLVYLLPALACLLSALVSCRKSFRAELDKLTLTHIFMIRNISQLLN